MTAFDTALFSEVPPAIRHRGVETVSTGEWRSIAVLVPAHNEASVIESSLWVIVRFPDFQLPTFSIAI